MIKDSFLNDYKARKSSEASNNLKYFGLVFSFLLMVICFFQTFLIYQKNDFWELFWQNSIYFWFFIFLATFFISSSWSWIQKVFQFIGKIVEKVLFIIVLLFVYYLIVVPAGFFMKLFRKSNRQGWEIKKIKILSENKLPCFMYPYSILYYFIQNRAYAIIPVLIVIIILGLLLGIAQNPVVTPFVYTVF